MIKTADCREFATGSMDMLYPEVLKFIGPQARALFDGFEVAKFFSFANRCLQVKFMPAGWPSDPAVVASFMDWHKNLPTVYMFHGTFGLPAFDRITLGFVLYGMSWSDVDHARPFGCFWEATMNDETVRSMQANFGVPEREVRVFGDCGDMEPGSIGKQVDAWCRMVAEIKGGVAFLEALR